MSFAQTYGFVMRVYLKLHLIAVLDMHLIYEDLTIWIRIGMSFWAYICIIFFKLRLATFIFNLDRTHRPNLLHSSLVRRSSRKDNFILPTGKESCAY